MLIPANYLYPCYHLDFNLEQLKYALTINVNFQLQEDLLIHGDSVYDIIDKQDHASIQSELMRGLQAETSTSILDNGNEKRIFLCRMNVSRNARRQMRFGDQKVRFRSTVRYLIEFLIHS